MKKLILCAFALFTFLSNNAFADLQACQTRLTNIMTEADAYHQELLTILQEEVTRVTNYEIETISNAQNSVQNFITAVSQQDFEEARRIAKAWKGEIRTVNKWLKEQDKKISRAYAGYKKGKKKLYKNIQKAQLNCVAELS